MTGLVLSGGGLRGAYEVGAYQAFLDCHIKLDGFAGTSIGAINAVMIASGMYKELKDFWYNGDIAKVLGFEISDKKLKELFINTKNVIENKGISLKPLRELLSKYNIDTKLYKSDKDFCLVTVRLKNYKHEYVFKSDIPENKLIDYLISTCSLPIFKLEKLIDNNIYIDGGFYDNLPVNGLLRKGYKKVYAINLEAIGVVRLFDDKSKVIEIKPSKNLGSIMNTNQDNIRENIKIGYYDTIKVLKNLDGYKYVFKRKSNLYYKLLIRHVNKKIIKEMQVIFNASNSKELIIKALEHVMDKNEFTYFNIYNPNKVIEEIKLMNENYGVYKFINELKTF